MRPLEIEQKDSIDVGLEIRPHQDPAGNAFLEITCSDDWCGSTETGFGASVSFFCTKEQVEKIINYMNEWRHKK